MRIRNLRIGLICAALLVSRMPAAQAIQYPMHHPVPGGVAVVKLAPEVTGEYSAKFGRRPIMVLDDGSALYGVVGLELDTPLGNYVVTVHTAAGDTVTEGFTVIPFSYPFKAGSRAGGLPPLKLPATWRPELDAEFPLVYPVTATGLESFGTRFAQGENIAPVECVMLRAADASEVLAPGGGAIADLKEQEGGYFFITIDHGMSLYSSVGPIKNPRPKQGQTVRKGEIVGVFDQGQSAATTLNWQVSLNGANVNPLLFTEGFKISPD